MGHMGTTIGGRHEGDSGAPVFWSPVVDEASPLVRVSALCSVQCFDTDGCVVGRTSGS